LYKGFARKYLRTCHPLLTEVDFGQLSNDAGDRNPFSVLLSVKFDVGCPLLQKCGKPTSVNGAPVMIM
jgi:hypothetical protein